MQALCVQVYLDCPSAIQAEGVRPVIAGIRLHRKSHPEPRGRSLGLAPYRIHMRAHTRPAARAGSDAECQCGAVAPHQLTVDRVRSEN